MQYWNDVHNRLYKIEDESTVEVFSGQPIKSIDHYIRKTDNPQRFIIDSILIFMERKTRIEEMLWTASGGAYYQDLQKIEDLSKKIENGNKELKLL